MIHQTYCKRCDRPKESWQVYCGAACTAQAEARECTECYGRGYYPVWVEDGSEPYGGYEDGERYCDCPAGKKRRERER